ncbi:MAG TPA: HRDC domain-containing protein, partial [Archangium sp.]|nr:HRDC domain-containing protein [Archangium sp.]
LKRMTDYAYTKTCRRAFILQYFGQKDVETTCGNCDTCAGSRLKRLEGLDRPATAPRATPTLAPGRPDGYSELAATELRRWRKELARDLEVPPFIIFNDETLRGLAAALPIDRESFLTVKGTGESRWERFGPKVVEICLIARAAGHEPIPVAPVPPRVRKSRSARH